MIRGACSAGYPITSWAVKEFATKSTIATTNVRSSLASDQDYLTDVISCIDKQVSSITNFPSLIDSETPDWAYTRTSFTDGETEYTLVFSDEFNTDGRTFYPGDDPYWTAVDLHYWQTDDLEWYDPAAVTTANGSLQITLSKKSTHGLDYEGGMVQTWNKFCFTGGIVETSVVLPGINNVMGLWPAVWTMGNLGRAGYGATLDGMVRLVPPRPVLWLAVRLADLESSVSGPILTTLATSARLRIKPKTVFQKQQQSTAIPHMVAFSPTSAGNVSHGVHARGSRTRGLCMMTGHTSGDQLQKSICLRRR